MADFKNLFISPRGKVEESSAKDTAAEAELIVGSRRVVRNETRFHTSGSAQTLADAAFNPITIAGDTSRDVNSGSDVFQEAAAASGDNLSWAGHRSTVAHISYAFRAVAPAAGGMKTIQVAHLLSGANNGNEYFPSDISTRYFRINTHHISSSMASDWVTGHFTVPVDSRMRTSGSFVTARCPGTCAITSASISVFEG